LTRYHKYAKRIIAFVKLSLIGDFLSVKVGDKAPDFTLPSQMGDDVTLSEYFGKKNVVLYFYPKDETRRLHERSLHFPRQL
jgi:hypothetical protein